jgi:hypothetical protein
MMPKVKVQIALLRSDQGGRTQAIPAARFGCPVFFEDIPELADHAYDCRFLVAEHGGSIAPGETTEGVEVVFLSPETVLPHIRPGVRFTLWEGKPIGKGQVVSVE